MQAYAQRDITRTKPSTPSTKTPKLNNGVPRSGKKGTTNKNSTGNSSTQLLIDGSSTTVYDAYDYMTQYGQYTLSSQNAIVYNKVPSWVEVLIIEDTLNLYVQANHETTKRSCDIIITDGAKQNILHISQDALPYEYKQISWNIIGTVTDRLGNPIPLAGFYYLDEDDKPELWGFTGFHGDFWLVVPTFMEKLVVYAYGYRPEIIDLSERKYRYSITLTLE